MKLRYKLTALIFTLILLVSYLNYMMIEKTVEKLLTKRLETAETLLAQDIANDLYRKVIEKKQKEITAVIFQEQEKRISKIRYIVVHSISGEILAHTFLASIPPQIYELEYQFTPGETFHIYDLLSTSLNTYNVSVPIMEGILQVGALHIGIDKEFIFNSVTPLRNTFTNFFSVAGFVLLIGTILAYFISTALTRTISSLVMITTRISQGDYSQKIDIKGNDEVAMLAHAISVMRDNIKYSAQKMKEYNEKLQGLVQERTIELEQKNKELYRHHEKLKKDKDIIEEQRKNLRIAFSSMDFGLFIINKDKSIALINDHAQAFLKEGLPLPITCTGKSNSIEEDCIKKDETCPFHTVFTEKKSCIIEQEMYDDTGTQRFFKIQTYPAFDKKHDVVQMVESCVDITKHKQQETKRIQLEQDLNRAQKLESIGTLAAGIAHEINTPIQFVGDNTNFAKEAVNDLFYLIEQYKMIIMECEKNEAVSPDKLFAQLDEDADLTYLIEELPKSIQQSLEGIEHVSSIVKAMKDFSHIGENKSMQFEDINKAIETTIIISKNEWKYHAKIEKNLDYSLPLVLCHIGEIKQVLLNLIVNAAHAIADKFANPEVIVASDEKGLINIVTSLEKNWIQVAVSDNGSGIPTEIQNKVFDHFFTTKEVGQGTGQGLSVAYRVITEKHGGKIWFDTQVGVGSTFYFTLKVEDIV